MFYSPNLQIDVCATFLNDSYQDLINLIFPLEKRIKKTQFHWFNNDLRELRNQVQAIATIFSVTKSPIIKSQLDKLKLKYKNAIVSAKQTAFQTYISNSKNPLRDGWTLINQQREKSCRR